MGGQRLNQRATGKGSASLSWDPLEVLQQMTFLFLERSRISLEQARVVARESVWKPCCNSSGKKKSEV